MCYRLAGTPHSTATVYVRMRWKTFSTSFNQSKELVGGRFVAIGNIIDDRPQIGAGRIAPDQLQNGFPRFESMMARISAMT